MVGDYTILNDESLLLLFRNGIVAARDVLTVRYFKDRKKHLKTVCPLYYDVLDDWDYNEIFFRCYLQAETTFAFGKGKFSSYFKIILSREVMKEVTKKLNEKRLLPTISFDSNIGEEGSLCTLHDIVSSNCEDDDPKVFFSYCDTLTNLNKLPKGVNKIGIEIAKDLYAGFSLEEAAKRKSISKSAAKMYVYRFRKWAKTIIFNSEGDYVDSASFLNDGEYDN